MTEILKFPPCVFSIRLPRSVYLYFSNKIVKVYFIQFLTKIGSEGLDPDSKFLEDGVEIVSGPKTTQTPLAIITSALPEKASNAEYSDIAMGSSDYSLVKTHHNNGSKKDKKHRKKPQKKNKKYPNKLGRIAPLNLWYGD